MPIAAVNCVKPVDGELVGDNTDGRGFLASDWTALRAGAAARTCSCVGAGGAARAVAVEAALAGAASVTDLPTALLARRRADRSARPHAPAPTRTSSRGRSPHDDSGRRGRRRERDLGRDAATRPTRWRWTGAPAPGRVAADVVIGSSTRFLDEAANAGWRRLDGLQMLVEQAVLGFRWWTGAEPDRDAMRAALADALP